MLPNVGLPVASGRESGGVLLTVAQADRPIIPAHTSSPVANRAVPLPAIRRLRVRFGKVRVNSMGDLVGVAARRDMNGMNGMTPLSGGTQVIGYVP